MIKKKIVISGATSSLMNAVIDLIQIQNKYHIIGITTNFRKEYRKDIEWVERDLAKSENTYAFIKDAYIIIHAAAISNAYTQQEYLNVNLQCTKTLVDNAKSFGVKKFVYISSILACTTCGDYGLSKVLSEKYIKSNIENWLIIRPSQLYGYSEKSPIDKLIKKIISKKIIPSPIGDSNSLIPLYYLDAARMIFDAVFDGQMFGNTKFIIGSQAFNYKSLIFEIAKSLKKKVFIIPVPKIILMSLKQLIQILGIKAGVYPDQIFRLYNPNKNVKAVENNKLTYLSEYAKRQFEAQ